MATRYSHREAFELNGTRVLAGTREVISLPVPDLFVHADLSIPVHVVHGKKDGPTLFLSGAVHGDEIIGVEIIRRVLSARRISRISGTLIAVPIVNIFGFLNQSRYLPDRRDLNRSFPGSERGSIAARLAKTFTEHIMSQCTHGIDLHTAAVNRENLPQIRAALSDNSDVEDMAIAFGLPVVVNSETIEGSLRHTAHEMGIKTIVYEAGEALRFDETAIRGGVNGILRVMESIGMLRMRKRAPATNSRLKPPTIASNSRWVRAPQSGIHRSIAPLGARVSSGETLGFIADPLGENESPVTASMGGVIIGRSNIPLVTEGEALFHIASFEAPHGQVARQIDLVEEVLESVATEIDEPPIV